MVSELHPGKTIGFALMVDDYDPEPSTPNMNLLLDPDACDPGAGGGTWGVRGSADCFADGLLLGSDTVVEDITWARIKATFVK